MKHAGSAINKKLSVLFWHGWQQATLSVDIGKQLR